MNLPKRIQSIQRELQYLAPIRADPEHYDDTPIPHRENDPKGGEYKHEMDLIQRIIAIEDYTEEPALIQPEWHTQGPITRIAIAARYAGSDAFGASRFLADLDLTTRAAGALYRTLTENSEPRELPEALRTHQAGLHILDARVGSFDTLLTLWGYIAALAASQPVAVAALLSMTWDAKQKLGGSVERWRGRSLAPGETGRPYVDEGNGSSHSQLSQLLSAPMLRDAALGGHGLRLDYEDSHQKVSITVLPK